MENLVDYVKTKKFLVAAHRGASGIAMGNSLNAFQKAVEIGVDLIEADIQFTKDHQIVTYHDFFPEGLNKTISKVKYKDLVKHKQYGAKLSEFDDLVIPLLSELIDLIYDKCYLMLEIKTLSSLEFEQNLNYLLQLIQEKNYQKKCLFGSFNYNVLKIIRTQNKDIPLAAIKIPNDNTLPSVLRKAFEFQAYVCSIDELNEEIVHDANSNNIFIACYGVEDSRTFRKAVDLGAKALGTNHPEKIKKLIETIL